MREKKMRKSVTVCKKRLLCLVMSLALTVMLFPRVAIAEDTPPQDVNEQPTTTPVVETQPTETPIVEEPPIEKAEAMPDTAPITQENNEVSSQSTSMDAFVIKFYDKSRTVVENVNLPDPIKMVVVDGTGNPVVDEAYSFEWYYGTSEDDEPLGNYTNTLAFPYTCLMNTKEAYPIKVVVKENATSIEKELEAGEFAIDNGATVLAVNQKPVYKGKTVDGVTLSADEKTITLNGVNINNTTYDLWGGSSILVQSTRHEEINLIIKGTNNNITSSVNSGINFGLYTESDSTLNISGGGTLNVALNCETSGEKAAVRIAGLGGTRQNFVLDGRTMLNLKGKAATEPLNYAGSAIEIGPLANFRVENGTINGETDGFRVVELLGDSESKFYVGPKGSMNLTSKSTIEVQGETPGSANICGLFFGGDEAEINGGNVDIKVNEQKSSTVAGYFAADANTVVKNGGTLTSDLGFTEVGEQYVEGIFGVISKDMVVDGAKVETKVRTDNEKPTAVWGIGFADTLDIKNNSTVNVDIDGGIYEGIRFGGYGNAPDGENGTVSVTDSNVKIKGKTTHDEERTSTFIPSGISARYLTTNLTTDQYKVEIETAAVAHTTSAVSLQKPSTQQKVDYNLFYVPERLKFGRHDGITIPEDGVTNLYGYKEEPDALDYISLEVIYGADKTKPAANAIISVSDYVVEERKSTDGKLTVTGNIKRGAQLTVKSDLHKTCVVCSEMHKLKDTKEVLFLGDISLTGVEKPYKGELGLTFQADSKYNGKTLSLMHCIDGKNEMKTAVVQNGQVRFAVTSLSPFALYADPTPVVMTSYTVKASASKGGAISPSGDVAVIKGTNAAFTFTPDNGYKVGHVTVDGQTVKTEGATYTIVNVAADHTIHAEFVKTTGPKTGDSTNMMVWLMVLLGAVGAIGGSIIYLKRRQHR